jgi:hypothetical protein
MENPEILQEVKLNKSKEYYARFSEKNHDKIHTKIICDLCGHPYTYFNKSRHYKSRTHNFIVNKIDEIKQYL